MKDSALATDQDSTTGPTAKPGIASQRKVSVWLWIGIVVAPYIFAWFTLRKGHINRDKMIAFSWMLIFLAIQGATPQSASGSSEATSATTFDSVPRQLSCVDGDPKTSSWDSGAVMNFNEGGQLMVARNGAVFVGKWWREGDNFVWRIMGGSLPDGRSAPLNKPAVTWVAVRTVGKNGAGESINGLQSNRGIETFCLSP